MSILAATESELATAGEESEAAVSAKADTGRGRLNPGTARRILRWSAILAWALGIGYWIRRDGVSFDRNTVLIYICTGLLAASVGRRQGWTVLRDWLPFAAVLLVYDLSRGAAEALGRPTEWYFQMDFDRVLFRVEPTVWLQSKLKEPFAPWWEVGVSIVYVSFFFAPYLVAGLLWLRDRPAWRQFVFQFVAVSFIGLAGFIAVPAAPPWAASLCSAEQVAGGPSDPACMYADPDKVGSAGILGQVRPENPGAAAYVERISGRGWDRLGLERAKALLDQGQAGVNQVAAVPSLHAAVTGLITVFFWRRVRRRWRPLLAGYSLAMAFALVYSSEHYVFDILLGWVVTAVVTIGFGRWQRSRSRAGVEARQAGADREQAGADREQAGPDRERACDGKEPVRATDTLDGSSPTRS
ncbi:MAG TPA: phosphatase PAP2 family protein [Jatrophihabitans sp.]|uniref:phosphatase PAP2 family protein n=1 Tax=Jatrophihabitans sp. TaxID=1932789 RepID=UPI002EFB0BDC